MFAACLQPSSSTIRDWHRSAALNAFHCASVGPFGQRQHTHAAVHPFPSQLSQWRWWSTSRRTHEQVRTLRSRESSHPLPAARQSICHVSFISRSSSGSPAHDQISPSISCYLAQNAPSAWPASLSSQPDATPAALRLRKSRLRILGLSISRLRGEEKRPRFLLRRLAFLWFINIWDINYIFIYRVSGALAPQGDVKNTWKVEEQ